MWVAGFCYGCICDSPARAAVAWPFQKQCISEKARSWSCQASKVRCRITWALVLLTKSLLESPLCQNYLQGMGFSCILSSILHTAKSDSDCILLCWVNSRYPRGTDGSQELCWIELQAPSCSWVRIYLTGSVVERAEHPHAQCQNCDLPLFCQLQGLSWKVPAQCLNFGLAAVQRCCSFHWLCLGR